MAQLLRCPGCGGQLHFDPGQPVTTCQFCGGQIHSDHSKEASDAPAAGQLDEAICVVVSEDLHVPLIERGAPLPATHRETIAGSKDQQESVTVTLRAGESRGRPLATAYLEVDARVPRGMPLAQLTIEVSVEGAVRVLLREEGTTNTVSHSANVSVAT